MVGREIQGARGVPPASQSRLVTVSRFLADSWGIGRDSVANTRGVIRQHGGVLATAAGDGTAECAGSPVGPIPVAGPIFSGSAGNADVSFSSANARVERPKVAS